jgi:hypothetical protein
VGPGAGGTGKEDSLSSTRPAGLGGRPLGEPQDRSRTNDRLPLTTVDTRHAVAERQKQHDFKVMHLGNAQRVGAGNLHGQGLGIDNRPGSVMLIELEPGIGPGPKVSESTAGRARNMTFGDHKGVRQQLCYFKRCTRNASTARVARWVVRRRSLMLLMPVFCVLVALGMGQLAGFWFLSGFIACLHALRRRLRRPSACQRRDALRCSLAGWHAEIIRCRRTVSVHLEFRL